MIDMAHRLFWLFRRPIAHRGLHRKADGIIENSMSAFAGAIEHGFGIECDVQITSDLGAVVFHDFTLDRLTQERGDVAGWTSEALCRVQLNDTGDRISSLGDVIEFVAGRVPLVIEIKSRFRGDLRPAEIVADIVSKRPAGIAVKSFDPDIVHHLQTLAPSIPRGFIGMDDYEHDEFAHLTVEEKLALSKLKHFERMQPDFLSWRVRDLPASTTFLRQASHGVPMMSWTVRTEEDRRIVHDHADQMVFEGFLPQA